MSCPQCGREVQFALNTYPSSSIPVSCENCNANIQASRSRDGKVNIRLTSKAQLEGAIQLTEEIISKVKDLLPNQPWPKSIHKQVAKQLGLSNSIVQKAVEELIKRRIFKQQIGGSLYDLVEINPVEQTSQVNKVS